MFQIISNNADHFLDHIPSASTPDPKTSNHQTSNLLHPKNTSYLSPSEMKVLNLNDNECCESNDNKIDDKCLSLTKKISDDFETIVVTPKKTKRFNKENCDGIVLTRNDDNEFLEPSNISPILQNNQMASSTMADGLHNIQEEEEDVDHTDHVDNTMDTLLIKRKRDSFDNISIISTDSLAPIFNSAKKPKLIRTGSITRTLRRSMSFVAMKNPISTMIRSRRNSVDPNASINSVTSIESTFNESIKRPVKEKLRNIKERIMKTANGNKKDFCLTPKTPKVSKKFGNLTNARDPYESPEPINGDNIDASFLADPFKTPLAPIRSTAMSATKSYHNNPGATYGSFSSHPLNSTMIECTSTMTHNHMDATTMNSVHETMVSAATMSPVKRLTIQQLDTMSTTMPIYCDGNIQEVVANPMIMPAAEQIAVLTQF